MAMEKLPLISSIITIQQQKHYQHYHQHHQQQQYQQQQQQQHWFIILITFQLLVFSSAIKGLLADCPNLCECKWKGGKESVLCLNANLTGIPIKLDPGTQLLDLTGNEIIHIQRDAFNIANLLNLQKVYVVRCRLKSLDRYAFRNLINLVELDLSGNALTMIPSHTFDAIHELRELSLNSNPIQRVMNDAFKYMSELVRLELSNCKINQIDSRAFNGLEKTLTWLKLDGNKLIDIRPIALTTLYNLHGLELAGNPWNCSCSLRPLREWMINRNVPINISPICRYPPRLATKSWERIDLDEFACVPHIMASDNRAYGIEGKNITMSCMVDGIPEPNVRWILRNRIIANLTGANTILPAAQGRKLYIVNLQQNSSNLTILTADVQDAGIYTCAAENKAGKVEASVTLAVSRKPPDDTLSTKVLIASVIVAILFVIASSLAVLCICTLRKRQKLTRWTTQTRRDSYEKIELNHKPSGSDGGNRVAIAIGGTCSGANRRSGDGGGGGGSNNGGGIAISTGVTYKSPRTNEHSFIKPYLENGISVVSASARRITNGDYRNVPSEDDGTGYEDNLENNIIIANNINSRRGGEMIIKWKKDITKVGTISGINTTSSSHSTNSITSSQPITIPNKFSVGLDNKWSYSSNTEYNKHINNSRQTDEETDLHIPRLIEFSDSTPDSSSCISAYKYDSKTSLTSSRINVVATPSTSSIPNITSANKLNWSQHLLRKQHNTNNSNDDTINVQISENSVITNKPQYSDNNNRTPDSDCDSEKKYPDLLDISNFNNNSNISDTIGLGYNNNSINNTNSYNNKKIPLNSSIFSTIPRKKHGKFFNKTISDSQSPLLPECSSSSRYSSSNSSSFSDTNQQFPDNLTRRFSTENYSNYPLSFDNVVNNDKTVHHINTNNNSANNTDKTGINNNRVRSNSYLNLVSPSSNYGSNYHKRNPSLPTTPTKENTTVNTIVTSASVSPQTIFTSTETPLLDFSSLTSRNQFNGTSSHLLNKILTSPITPKRQEQSIASPSPIPLSSSRSTKTNQSLSNSGIAPTNVYDLHAAHLELFLQAYRNLQQNLMICQEKCDIMQQSESTLRIGTGSGSSNVAISNSNSSSNGGNCSISHSIENDTIGQSAKFADPMMYTAAALGGATGLNLDTSTVAASASASTSSTNPTKTLLKSKTLLPGQTPDPPPYWLHRSAMLKRIQDSNNDLFQS